MNYLHGFLIVLISCTVACAAGGAAPDQPAGDDAMSAFIEDAVTLTPDAPVTVSIDGECAVVLEENPSTGYGWAYTVTPEGALTPTGEKSFSRSEGTMVGASVTAVWKFKAQSPGNIVLTFRYYRPWEKPETAVETRVFTIIVVK